MPVISPRLLHDWRLHEPILFTERPTGSVFRVRRDDRSVVLKVFTEIGRTEEGPGSLALRHWNGEGSVHLLEFSEDAQLLEDAGDETLLSLSDRDDRQALEIAARALEILHRPRAVEPPKLPTLAERFRALNGESPNPLLREAAAVARELLSEPRDLAVLHGDFHHGNLLRHPERGWLAIDPKGLWGERTFDAANLFYNPEERPELLARTSRVDFLLDLLSERLNLDRQRLQAFAFAYGGLSATWFLEDGLPADATLAVLALLRP